MRQHTPHVSVIITTYNRAERLPRSLQSILCQTFQDFEVIIVDDGSTDNTADVSHALAQKDQRIRYLRHEKNKGIASARNTGCANAQGYYIAFQDDDDISLPTRLEKQIDFLKTHKDVDAVIPWTRVFSSHGFLFQRDHPLHIEKKPPTPVEKILGMHLPPAAILARTTMYQRFPFRPFFTSAEDYDCFLRWVGHYKITHLPEVLYQYNIADQDHKTLTTGSTRQIDTWKNHCLAWMAAFHRQNQWHDPIDKATSIADALNNIHPDFAHKAQHAIQTFLIRELAEKLLAQPLLGLYQPTIDFAYQFGGGQACASMVRHLRHQTRLGMLGLSPQTVEKTYHTIDTIAQKYHLVLKDHKKSIITDGGVTDLSVHGIGRSVREGAFTEAFTAILYLERLHHDKEETTLILKQIPYGDWQKILTATVDREECDMFFACLDLLKKYCPRTQQRHALMRYAVVPHLWAQMMILCLERAYHHRLSTCIDMLNWCYPKGTTRRHILDDVRAHTPRIKLHTAWTHILEECITDHIITRLQNHVLFLNEMYGEKRIVEHMLRHIHVKKWKTGLHYCIKEKHLAGFRTILTLSLTIKGSLSMLAVSHKIIFACIRTGRIVFLFDFIRLMLLAPFTSHRADAPLLDMIQ
ncbi:MAG: glycosyltransferase family 2 protein [Alphaproteobacteria bacterium GM7ARS4]|nr:glycosyltransferase family 2 protein [Alphaproteobacteria bacterium GM7ARS4]